MVSTTDRHSTELPRGGFTVGDWRVRPLTNRISRGDTERVLEPRVMEVLVCLAKRRGETVTKEQFMDEVWEGTVVTDDVLSRCISELRKALDDDSRNPHVIETIRKTGYRLIAPVGLVTDDEHAAALGRAERSSPPAEARRHDPFSVARLITRPNVLAMSLGIFFVAMVILIVLPFDSEREAAPPVPTPLTSSPGLELDAAISPDGKQVAYASDNGTGRDFDIYIAQKGAAIPLRLTDDPGDDRHPAWSPDGLRLAFVRDTNGGHSVFVIPSIGGPARKIAAFENRRVQDIAWAPKGGMIAIAAQSSAYGVSSIYLVSEDSLALERLTFPPTSFEGGQSLAFSPDGSRLAFVRAMTDEVQDIFIASIESGLPRQISFDSTVISGLDWTADGEEIVFGSVQQGASGLWRIATSGGEARRFLSSLGDSKLEDPSVSRTGDRLVYVEHIADANIWRLWRDDEEEPFRAHPLIFSTRWDSHPDISPDGQRIAYASEQSGRREIWVSDRAGRNQKQITQSVDALASVPRWSPDGTEIAFASRRQGRTEILIVSEEGGRAVSVGLSPRADAIPAWSRDGSHIYYAAETSGRPEIWRAPRDSGSAVQITADGGVAAIESIDGTELFYVRPDTTGIWKVRLADGQPGPQNGQLVVGSVEPRDRANWCAVIDGIYFIQRDRWNPVLMFYSFETGQRAEVATLRNLPHEPALAISPDQTWIVYTQDDERQSDVMLLEPFH